MESACLTEWLSCINFDIDAIWLPVYNILRTQYIIYYATVPAFVRRRMNTIYVKRRVGNSLLLEHVLSNFSSKNRFKNAETHPVCN